MLYNKNLVVYPLSIYNGLGTSLVVQWLKLHAFIVGYVGLIPGQGTEILHGQKKKKSNKLFFFLSNKF